MNKPALTLAAALGAFLPATARGQEVIFGDGFESGDLSAWSASATDGGDLSVSPDAAMGGTSFGLRALVNDTTGLYVQDDTSADEDFYRARFWLDPSGFDPGESQAHRRTRVFILFEEGPNRRLVAVVLRRLGGQYALMGRAQRDDNTRADTGFTPVTAGPHLVELEWKRASGLDANDGEFRFWIDGTPAGVLTGLDNDRSAADFVRLGALSVKGGAAGTLAWDEFGSFRTVRPVAAQVVINEFNANIGVGCDLIELRVVSGGSMDGYTLRERDVTTLVTFAGLSVNTNDIVVVHLNGAAGSTCNPESSGNDTTSPTQFPSAIFPRNYDSAYDWYSLDGGLAATDNVLTLSDGVGQIMDAVLAADDAAGMVSTGSENQAAAVAAAGQWQMIGGGVPAGGFVDDDFRAHAVLDLNQTGTTATQTSIQRTTDLDSNDKNGWTTGAGAAQTWGLLNSGQTPCCAATVEDIQTGLVTGAVNLNGVVVTALTSNSRSLWVADALAAAAHGGVYVDRGAAAPLAGIQPGAVVNLTGSALEFDAAPPGDTLTEIGSGTVALVSAPAGFPTPLTGIPAATLSSLAAGEPYEGVLVQLSNVRVTASAAGDRLTLRDNGSGTIVMDDVAHDYAAVSYPVGTCFAAVTGVMHLDTVADVRLLLPRQAGDLVPGGTCN